MHTMNRVAIIGTGTSAHFTALYLIKNHDVVIDCYFPKNADPIGVGEATTNYVQDFLTNLGIDKKCILKHANGSLKLGLEFCNFLRLDHSFFHPFGDELELSAEIEYMMKRNKVPDDILEYDTIATHFDTQQLSKYILNIIEAAENISIRDEYFDVSCSKKYDTVIDCTGFKRSVIDKVCINNFKNLSDVIPNNCALVYRAGYTDEKAQKLPYTKCVGLNFGWCWNIPLGNKISYGYVHDSKHDVRQEFINYIKNRHGACDECDIRSIPFVTGRNEKHVVTKDGTTYISIGLSSCFIEPLESTGLHFVVEGIELLGRLLNRQVSVEDFNRMLNESYDSVLDFILAHYKYTERSDSYWSSYTDKHLTRYKQNGVFPDISWDYILSGMQQLTKSNINRLSLQVVKKHMKSGTYNTWVKNEKYT